MVPPLKSRLLTSADQSSETRALASHFATSFRVLMTSFCSPSTSRAARLSLDTAAFRLASADASFASKRSPAASSASRPGSQHHVSGFSPRISNLDAGASMDSETETASSSRGRRSRRGVP